MTTWSMLREELPRLGITRENGKQVSEVTETVARARGIGPEKVMDGLLEGVERGELVMNDGIVRCR